MQAYLFQTNKVAESVLIDLPNVCIIKNNLNIITILFFYLTIYDIQVFLRIFGTYFFLFFSLNFFWFHGNEIKISIGIKNKFQTNIKIIVNI